MSLKSASLLRRPIDARIEKLIRFPCFGGVFIYFNLGRGVSENHVNIFYLWLVDFSAILNVIKHFFFVFDAINRSVPLKAKTNFKKSSYAVFIIISDRFSTTDMKPHSISV